MLRAKRLILLRRGFAALAFLAVGATLALSSSSAHGAGSTPDQVGQWAAPVAWPLVAVHMTMQPSGSILTFDGFDAALNSERLWDPTTQSFLPIPYGRNLFCAGHVLLPNGETLIVGGHISADNGLADTTIFNPANNTWVREPDMTVGRWYPTATELPNGKVLVFSGDNIVQDRAGQVPPLTDASVNSLPEIFNPANNTWQDLTSSRLTTPLYPFMFVLSDGRILDAGPDTTTRILTPGSWAWSTIGASPFDGMSAVMYRPNKIMKSGSWADPDFAGAQRYNAQARTAVIDMNQPNPTWRETAPMNFARAYHNLTLLPDGTVFASGGGSVSDGVDLTKSVLPAEIWNPDTETWTTVASLQNGRLYHSTALLLQDGRVLMAGGGAFPSGNATDQKNAEIYSPPYLFKGARPTITSAPFSTTYGSTFTVNTPDAANIASISLIRTPSVTHAFDQNQRFMRLNFTAGSGALTVTAPAGPTWAPPGDYMLFLVNNAGVPSVAKVLDLSGPIDTTPPTVSITAPSAGAGVSGAAVTLSANASDNDTVGGVTFQIDGTVVGTEDQTAPYSVSWDSATVGNGTHTLTAIARDITGNSTTSASVLFTVSNAGAPPPPGLVAAYGFDEGSGTTVADKSGNNNNGTIANATWSTSGKFGSALSFNGTNSMVTVPDSASLDLTSAMTLEAWVKPAVTGNSWRTVLFKENTNYYAYALYGSTGTGFPSANAFAGGGDHDTRATSGLALNTWTHLAATYDGASLKLYVNGTQAATLASSGNIVTTSGVLRIGGNNIWSEWFNGLVDEVRVYNRALTAVQIQDDMNTSISTPDSTPPSAPGTLSATGGLGSSTLSWSAATDNVGLAKYDVYRSTTSGFTPSTANRIGQPTSLSYSDTGLAPGTYYYRVAAEDAAGNIGAPTNEASSTVTSDTTPPTVAISTPSPGATLANVTTVSATASDNGSVAGVQFKLDGANLGSEDTIAPYSIQWDTTTAANGTHTLSAVARDAAGNSATSATVSVTVTNTAAPAGLVAAYGFDETSGTTTADQSGNGNTGTLSNATRSIGGGKFGSALSFNGTNSIVNVADSNSLDLTSAMTIEAWVKPTVAGGNAWRTVALKENGNNYAYALYGNTGTAVPSGNAVSGGVDHDLRGTSAVPANVWTHLAVTYDGTVLALYLNGTQVSSQIASGLIVTSTGALRIGGNNIWTEWFNGLIDELRIYNRALTAAQIQNDMNVAITNPDTTAPTAPGTLTATGGISSVSLSWGAATDNVGVVRYDVYRSSTAGFVPSAANRIAQPTGLTYTDPGLSPGNWFYKIAAEDAAGNIGPPTNEAMANVTGDITPPSTPGTLTANGGLSSVALSWGASTDNVGVTKYDVYRSTTSGFTPSTANRIAQPTGTTYTDAGLSPATYYYKVIAEDAAGNLSQASNEANGLVTGDTTPPSAPGTLTASAAATTVALNWGAATDNVGVAKYDVYRSTTAGFTPSAANRIAQPTSLTYNDTGLGAGTYYYRVTAEDAVGNVGAPSNEANATVVIDNTAPNVSVTGPAAGSTVSGTVTVTASASDNVGVVGVTFKVDNTTIGSEDTTSPYSVSLDTTGLSNGSHTLTAVARDAAGNSSTSAGVTVTVSNSVATPGLVAAYSFDAGSGTTVADLSGNGNNGTIANATWSTNGKFGSALSFNGTNSMVTVPDSASLDLTNGMTLEAWVNPAATGTTWRTVVFKENTNYYAYALYGSTGTGFPSANAFTGSTDRDTRATSGVALNTWTHLAATYDGASLKLYVNGTQAATLGATGNIVTTTGVLRIGGNNIWGEWFSGLIDEVRVYNRALTAAEIQSDMTKSVGTPDTTPPSAPGSLNATGALGSASLTWSASTDNTGVTNYNVYRSTTSGFTPSTANRIAQPTGTSYTDGSLAAGTYYYKVTAQDASGNVSQPSNESSAVVTADTTPPTVSITAPTAGTTVSNTVTLSANASDGGGVADVQFKIDGTNVGSLDTTSPYSANWDSRTVANGTHTVTATARDLAGNSTTSAGVQVTVSNTAPPSGLVAAYGFDEGTGTSAGDSSGNGNTGTLIANGPAWTIGKHGRALSFDGTNDWVTVPDANSLDLTNAMTLEAWVYPTAGGTAWRTVMFKEQTGDLVYGLYANRNTQVPNAQVYVGGSAREGNGTSALPLNQWSHLAATYDGTTLRLYVNGIQVGTLAVAGAMQASNGVLRIGGNNIWGEYFQGRIDDLMIYNRVLSAGEVQADMNRDAAPDTTPPSITSRSPAASATNVTVDSNVTATFDEELDPTSVTTSSVELRDGSTTVPASVAYDPINSVMTLTPTSALIYGKTYTVVVHGGTTGARVRDTSGNAPGSDVTWTFSTEGAPPPILVIGSTTNPFSRYAGEILKAEGLNEYATLDVSLISPQILGFYDVAVLGDMTLLPWQVQTLTDWVNAGGDLIALHPDPQLASLLGLTTSAATLSNAYMKIDTSKAPGAGITSDSMQYHGTADRYTLNGATAVAMLYSNAGTATTSPAVTVRSVGANGGHAAAFTYDLARSVVLTRQGNPAWAGQERDGVVPIRPDDLFFGAKSGDVQPDWLDTSKITIPQADEQQRLLANLIENVNPRPLPRFWYLPRMLKAALVLTGDDHAVGGTAGRFDQEISQSPAGCSVALWQCIRSTSYIYPASPITNAQAASYISQGFEVALHPAPGGVNVLTCVDWSPSQLDGLYTTQLQAFAAKYTSVPAPVTSRTHCVTWDDWGTQPKVEAAHGITADMNYYHYPGSWIGTKNGFMTGSGFPMKFADTDGTVIPEYQFNTNMTDESGQSFPTAINSLLDGALGPNGYYGVFVANFHTDNATSPEQDATVPVAQSRGIPMISAKQALDWTVGRNASTFSGFTWSGGVLHFTLTAGSGATGLSAMVPATSSAGTIQTITRGGSNVTFTLQTIKGIQYATFDAAAGSYDVKYG
jgi:hypothetical protein